jgi:hypothetical protein
MVVGLLIGLGIDRNARRDRDERISELERELTTQRNIVKSLDEDNVKLRRRLKQYAKAD